MGTIQIDGSTPKLTIGNATAEDALIVFDGNAQDFYIGLDDSADDLVIGLGSAAGTTPAISINEDRDVTISDGAIDFDVASHDTSNGLKLGGTLVTATAAELNIMDGVTSTAAEINLIDGGTARGTTALADGDGILINDAGTMRMTNVTAVKTYMATAALAGIDDQTSSNDDQLTITDSEVVINEDSDDLDFRVESNGNANMLFVDGGSNLVGVGGDPDLGTGLHIRLSDTGASANNNAPQLVIEHGTSNEQCGISILSANDMLGNIFFGDDGDDDIGALRYNHDGNLMTFVTAASERMRIDGSGNWMVGTTAYQVYDNTSGEGLGYEAGGELQVSRDSGVAFYANRTTNDGTLVNWNQAGGTEGSITVSGSTVAYNAFCGSHWSRLADNSKPTILRGTVMESIATLLDWYACTYTIPAVMDSDGNVVTKEKGKKTEIALPDGKSVGDVIKHTYQGVEYDATIVKLDNERLPMCKISDTEDSKAVYGVFMSWDDKDDGDDGDVNDMYVASIGAFVVRVHSGETVAIGDYLQSNGDGTAKVQADDILRASTIGKVTSTEKTHIHADDSYCVPCTLHCG